MTRAMIASGDTVSFGDLGRPTVDKHSTGGVADGVTLVFAPLAAALGLAVAKLSGRGLGHTGGTLDKLESIPGLRTDLSPDGDRRSGRARSGAPSPRSRANLVPADGALYALRDATATVPVDPADRRERDVEEARRGHRPDPARREGGVGGVHEDARGRRGARGARAWRWPADGARPAASPSPTCRSRSATPSATRSTSSRPSSSCAGRSAGRLRDLAVLVRRAGARRLTEGVVRRRSGGAGRARARRRGGARALPAHGRGAGRRPARGRRSARRSCRARRSSCRWWPTGTVRSPAMDAEAIGTASGALGAGPAPQGRPDRSRRRVSWCAARSATGSEAGEPIGEVHARSDDDADEAARRRPGRVRRLTDGDVDAAAARASAGSRAACVTLGLQPPVPRVYLAVSLLIGMSVREYARAFVAARLGDPTPRLWGRLTLKPKAWFEPFGSGLAPGDDPRSCGRSWRGVPAAAGRLREAGADRPELLPRPHARHRGHVASPARSPTWCSRSIAGLVLRTSGCTGDAPLGRARVRATRTCSLTVFHLLPIPGLDGARMVALILPPRRRRGLPERRPVPAADRAGRVLFTRSRDR